MKLSKPYYNIKHDLLEKDMPIIRERKFDNFIRSRVPFFMDEYRYAIKKVKDVWGLDVYFFEAGHERVRNAWLDGTLNEEAAKLWLEKMDTDPSFTKKLVKDLGSFTSISEDLAQSIPQHELSAEEIEKYIFKHLEYWVNYLSIGFLWFSVDVIVIELNERIKKEWAGSAEDYVNFIENIYRPTDSPRSSREQHDLLALKSLSGEEFEDALDNHWKKYRHLAARDIDDPLFTLEYFKERTKIFHQQEEYDKAIEGLEHGKKEMKNATKLLTESGLSEGLKDKIDFCRQIIYLRTETIDYWTMVNAAYKNVFQSIADLHKISIEETLYMTVEELINSLHNGLSEELRGQIKERIQNGYAYLIAPHGSYLVVGDEVDELQALIVPDKSDGKKIESFKGQTAFHGKVRGVVHIILDRRRANELKKGEVLVTGMTTPEFVPAMGISSAIITNEGGILCHAAILSRELRKPCIIGTKIATQVLKDGMEVEVDADNGTIRILSNE